MYQSGQFPLSETEFEALFSNEEACIDYLYCTRWPYGFTCPACLEKDPDAVASRVITCTHCGEQTSLTKGTIMDGTDLPLHDWLLALWWLSKRDGSTMEIPGRLKLPSYQTAGGWLHQLRVVMALADDQPCAGVVEIGSRMVVAGGNRTDTVLVLAAAERLFLSGSIGRMHIQVIDCLTADNIRSFVYKFLEPGCTIVGPKLSPYQEAARYGDVYVLDSGGDCPVGIYGVLSHFQSWLKNIHQQGGEIQYLQQYCDEYCFQHNTMIQQDQQSVFSSLLDGCFAGLAASCHQLART